MRAGRVIGLLVAPLMLVIESIPYEAEPDGSEENPMFFELILPYIVISLAVAVALGEIVKRFSV